MTSAFKVVNAGGLLPPTDRLRQSTRTHQSRSGKRSPVMWDAEQISEKVHDTHELFGKKKKPNTRTKAKSDLIEKVKLERSRTKKLNKQRRETIIRNVFDGNMTENINATTTTMPTVKCSHDDTLCRSYSAVSDYVEFDIQRHLEMQYFVMENDEESRIKNAFRYDNYWY